MANAMVELLHAGTELSAILAEMSGKGKVLNKSKKVLIDLTGKKDYQRKFRSIFCGNASEPKLEVAHNITGNSRNISMRFKDGTSNLSGMTLNCAENGDMNFSVNIVDSLTKAEKMSASGSYKPNEKFFEWNNCGEKIERRSGYTSAALDSTGFNIETKVDDAFALNVIKSLKNFLKGLQPKQA